jgi:hypothetical protein
MVLGDFFIWSEGPKLRAEEIAAAYVGINKTAVTHNNEQGILVPAVLQPPSSSSAVIAGASASASAGSSAGSGAEGAPQLLVQRVQDALDQQTGSLSSLLSMSPPAGAKRNPAAASTAHSHAYEAHHPPKHGYYVVYLLECVVRPDVELRELLACVLKVARTRDCKYSFPHNNHVILKANTTNPISSNTHIIGSCNSIENLGVTGSVQVIHQRVSFLKFCFAYVQIKLL